MEDIVDEIETGGEEGGDFGDFMKGIEESMLHMMKESAKVPETAMEQWQAFAAAIDWSETWIRGLLGFHVAMLFVAFLTRNSINAQTVLFLLICGLIFISEYLNTYCAANWQLFARQNYFDPHGVFAGTLYAGPLLIIALFQLVSVCFGAYIELRILQTFVHTLTIHVRRLYPQINFLRLSSSALIKAKRMEIDYKRKQQAKEDKRDVKDSADFSAHKKQE